jgi:hypothetical protein
MRSAPAYRKRTLLRAFGTKIALGIRACQRVYIRSALVAPRLVGRDAVFRSTARQRPPAGLHALRAGIPEADFAPCRQVRKKRLAYAPVNGFIYAPRRHTGSGLCSVPSGSRIAVSTHQWVYMRSAPAYPKQHLLRVSISPPRWATLDPQFAYLLSS